MERFLAHRLRSLDEKSDHATGRLDEVPFAVSWYSSCFTQSPSASAVIEILRIYDPFERSAATVRRREELKDAIEGLGGLIKDYRERRNSRLIVALTILGPILSATGPYEIVARL